MASFLSGDRIEIVFNDDPNRPVPAVVCAGLSDQQEGLGPEIEDYVACWIEVSLSTCDNTEQRRSIALGTDFRYSMDGRPLTLRHAQA